MIQYQTDASSSTRLLSSMFRHESVSQSPNSYSAARRIAYVREHRYDAHRRKMGIRFIWMKNPENRSCGTISAGISSAATAGSSTQLPMKMPMLVLAMASRKFRARKVKKFVWKPMRKKAATSWVST